MLQKLAGRSIKVAFTEAGKPYSLKFGSWKGTRIGVYSYNTKADGGIADFDFFTYVTDGPGTGR